MNTMFFVGGVLMLNNPEVRRDEVIGNDDCDPITKERFYQMIAELNQEPLFRAYLEHCKPTKDAIRRVATS